MEGPVKLEPREAHLQEGIKPIIVWVGIMNDFKKEYTANPRFGLKDLHNIDWADGSYHSEGLKRKYREVLTFGGGTYVISDIDSNNKFSENFGQCVGLVVVGRKMGTNENVSFMTHQPPRTVLGLVNSTEKEYFFLHLVTQLKKMIEICDENTMDCVIVGGGEPVNRYNNAVELLSSKVEAVLGISPVVVNGRKDINDLNDRIYFDNTNRRLYLIRSRVNQALDQVYPKNNAKK